MNEITDTDRINWLENIDKKTGINGAEMLIDYYGMSDLTIREWIDSQINYKEDESFNTV